MKIALTVVAFIVTLAISLIASCLIMYYSHEYLHSISQSYPVTIQEVGESKILGEGVTRITVKINQEIPNTTGWLTFDNKSVTEIAEYNLPNGDRICMTRHLVLYFDPRKTPKDLLNQNIQVHLRK